MKYLISKSLDEQKEERVKFVENLIKQPLYPRDGVFDGFHFYQTFPFIPNPDICLVFAHNKEVAGLLDKNIELISENNIFIISCAINYLRDYNIPNKNIYLCDQMDDDQVRFRKGSDFGIDFEVTDAEIYLKQSKETDPLKKFISCFNEIYHNAKE